MIGIDDGTALTYHKTINATCIEKKLADKFGGWELDLAKPIEELQVLCFFTLFIIIICFMLIYHMGAEPKNSFEEVPRGPLYGKLTTRYQRLRDYVSPNQTCKVYGDFGQKS